MLKEEDDYLNFLSLGYKIIWNEYRIYFPIENDYIIISSTKFPKETVKSRFSKLDISHIEYVLECMNHNTTNIKNIKKYLLAALYNAPTTIDSYYKARVQHDMPELAN